MLIIFIRLIELHDIQKYWNSLKGVKMVLQVGPDSFRPARSLGSDRNFLQADLPLASNEPLLAEVR
jgi:hypothetical protein